MSRYNPTATLIQFCLSQYESDFSLPNCLSIHRSLCLSLSLCISIYLSVALTHSFYLSVGLSLSLSLCHVVSASVSLALFLSLHGSFSVSPSLSASASVLIAFCQSMHNLHIHQSIIHIHASSCPGFLSLEVNRLQ